MKKMKKILSVILTLAMVLGMSVTTFAAQDDDIDPDMMVESVIGNANDTGSIEVKGITPESGITVTAYQIIKAKYENNDESFSGYEEIYKNVTPKIDVTTTTGDNKLVTISEAQLTAITDYIRQNKTLTCTNTEDGHVHGDTCYSFPNVAEGTAYPMELSSDGEATADNLPVGSYLVVVRGAETKVYNPAVVSIYYDVVDDKSENVLGGGKLDIVSTENVWIKVSDTPTVEKWMAGEEGNVKGNSANIGDTVEFAVPISPIPNYGGKYPVFNVVDTLDKGLDFNEDDFEVIVYESGIITDDEDGSTGATVTEKTLVRNTDYTLTIDSTTDPNKTKITVDFVVDGYADTNKKINNYTLNDYAGSAAVIKYSATLNDKAVINNNDNANDVVINYTKDSKISATDDPNIVEKDEDKTFTYTFDIDGDVTGSTTVNTLTGGILTKTGENTGNTITIGSETINNVLDEAEFTLYTVDPNNFTPEDGTDTLDSHVYTNDIFNGTVKSTSNGQLPIKGLAAGTYYLKETKAPDGYSLNTHVFKIVIDVKYYEEGDTTKPDGVELGELKYWTITIDDDTTNTFTVAHDGGTIEVYTNKNGDTNGTINKVTVPNTKLSSLPSTGGIGTTIFTFGGCAIMILAAALFFISRRKSAK